TLKCNQKYKKKGSRKRLAKEVVAELTHFMIRQHIPSDQYMEKDMLDRLKEMAENGKLTMEVIPSLKQLKIRLLGFLVYLKKNM
ncbi:5409_t:CDS:1, partial [Funneliformis geosporum]